VCFFLEQTERQAGVGSRGAPENPEGRIAWYARQTDPTWACGLAEVARGEWAADALLPSGLVEFSRSWQFLHEETALPPNAEKNPFTRTALILPLLYRCTDPPDPHWKPGWTRDLGPQGALVELRMTLPPPTTLALRFRTTRGAVDLPARVAWVGEVLRVGGLVVHGLTFPVLAPGPRRALTLLLDQQGPRGAVRIARTLALTCTRSDSQGPSLSGWTRDVSRNGLAAYLSQPIPPRIRLQLSLQTTSGAMAVEAEVVWGESRTSQPPGGPYRHGLRFLHLNPTQALALALPLTAG
jgi:hypothetical protein